MELLIDPVIIDDELPFYLEKKGGLIMHNDYNYVYIILAMLIIIFIIVIVWKFSFSYIVKVDQVETG